MSSSKRLWASEHLAKTLENEPVRWYRDMNNFLDMFMKNMLSYDIMTSDFRRLIEIAFDPISSSFFALLRRSP